MRIVCGLQSTKTNNEYFAITPYLFGVWSQGKIVKIKGLGICWGYYALYIAIGQGIPKEYPTFKFYK